MQISREQEISYKNSVTLGMRNEGTDVLTPPSDDVPADKKKDVWHLTWCKYIYNQDIRGSAFINLEKRFLYEMFREYSDGKQNEAQYLDIFFQDKQEGSVETKSKREAWVNINPQIFSIMPKFKKIIVNKAKEFKYRPVVTAVDDFSEMEREEMKYGLYAKSLTKPIKDQINNMFGLPQQEEEILPQSFSELEMFKDLGMFKLSYETAMEQAAIWIESMNFDDEVRDKVVEDMFTLNFSCVRDYVDPFTQQIRYEYVDPKFLIILGGQKIKNFRDITATGYYEIWNTTDFRKAFPEFTDDDVRKFWVKFQDWSLNNQVIRKREYLSDVANIPDFYIPILTCTFCCIDKHYEDKEVQINSKVRKSELDNKKIYEKDGKYYKRIANEKKGDLKVWRKAKWVIGTDIVFDWGLEHDQARDDDEVYPSFHIFELNGRSIVDMSLPVIDDLQLSWLQLQKLKATAQYSGIYVNVEALQNLKLGKQDINPLQAVDIFKQTGVLLFSDRNPNTGQGISTGVPIMNHQSNIANDLAAVLLMIKTDIDYLREITGISEIVSAGDPSGGVGLGVQQLSNNASVNALRDIFDGWQRIKEGTFMSIGCRIQNIAKQKDNKLGHENLSGAIGKAAWQTIVAAAEKSLRKWGIKLNTLPTDKEIAEFDQMIMVAMQSGKNGIPLITMADAMTLKRMLKQSHTSMKYIELYLKNREVQKAKEEQQIAMQNQQMQSQVQQQLEDKKLESALILKRAETDEQLKLVYANGYVQLLLQADERKQKDFEEFMTNMMGGNGQPTAAPMQPQAQPQTTQMQPPEMQQ